MNHFNDPGKYRLEVEGRPKLIEAWSIKYGQHYLPEIDYGEESVFTVEVEVRDPFELQEVSNSLHSMLLEIVHIKKVDYQN